jgi:Zn-dependent M28 family amino/carboxypeptidase
MVVIPGRDRSRAIIMADHYDTAYMEDRYRRGGARVAAPGADDNTSATAALLLASPVLLDLAREGRLGCDVWLVHLTGEEFPADCLGARHLSNLINNRSLALRLPDGRRHDLSTARVAGLYVLDMVAHENPAHPGVFQIAPGVGRQALRLALEAHRAAEAWNALRTGWDRHRSRRRRRARRGAAIPPTSRHPQMIGEVRPHDDPRSTLYNTDGRVFSDAGIPAVLFMEDYDINRKGYHDSRDTMAEIDLPYGAALVAIAIEAVARATWL